MKRFKRILKLGGLMLLIILASLGFGIGGGVPVPAIKRKEELNPIKVEMLEIKKDKSESNLVDLFKQE
jgi:hypothetical protein